MHNLCVTMHLFNFILQIRVSFEEVISNRDEYTFWTSLGKALRRSHAELKDIKSSIDFLDAFSQITWNEQKIVIFFDEFDELYNATNSIRNQFLQVLRAIRNNNNLYAA